MLTFVASLDPRDAVIHLVKDVLPRQSAARAEAAIVAKSAATKGHCPVNVGASESGIDTHSLDTKAKYLFQVKAVPEVPQARRFPIKEAPVMRPCEGRNISKI